MDLNNTVPPSSDSATPGVSPTGGAAAPAGQTPQQGSADESLYAQITAEDVVQPVPKKKKPAFFVLMLVYFMRLTFYLDSVKRTHEPVFRILAGIWGCFMFVIYFGGVLTLFLAVYSMMQLPLFLEEQLHQRGLEFENLHLADYSLTRIEVQNLKDSKGQYEVDSLVVHSTFTDFLQRRIRSVTLDGLKVNVSQDANASIFDELPLVLNELQNPTRGKLELTIDQITINDATLNFKQGTTTFPITFSMTGMYGKKTDIVIPLEIKQPNLTASGSLTISGPSNATDWTLDVTKGTLTLPKRSAEDFKGNIKFKVTKNRIDSVDFDFLLAYGTLDKNVRGTLTRVSDEGMNAIVSFSETNQTEPDMSTQIRLNFDELVLGQGTIESHKPVQVYMQSFVNPLMHLNDLNTLLKGDIVCRKWSECDISLTEPATVTVVSSVLSYLGKVAHGSVENSFILQPSDKTLFLSLYDPYLKLNWKMTNVNFAGYLDTEADPVTVRSETVDLQGYFSDSQKIDNKLSIKTTGTEYTTNKLQFKDGDISVSDVINPTRQVHISAKQIKTTLLPVLSMPFDFELVMVGTQSRMRIKPVNTPIVMNFEGQLLPFQPAFAGNIQIPPFELADLSISVNEISPLLSSNISNLSGKVAVAGRLIWKGQSNVSGPLKIAAKGVSFDWGKTRINNVNTVLSVTSLLPFATDSNQKLFVSEIQTGIPFMSTEATFQIESQSLRLVSLNSYVGDVEFSMPATIIPLRNPNVLLYLKNDAVVNLGTLFDYLNIPELTSVQGSATASIPVNIQNTKISIPSMTLKVANTTLKRYGDAWPEVFAGDTDYIVRSGQVVVGKNREIQVSLDGRLFPSRAKKSVEMGNLRMPSNLFKKGVQKAPSKTIIDGLKPFFSK